MKGQQNLARAKFHAPNGVVYGEGMYDGRMQAVRRCRVTEDPDGVVEVTAGGGGVETEKEKDSDASEKEKGDTADADAEDENDNTAADAGATNSSSNAADEYTEKADEKKNTKAKDPARMFGLLTPEALKKAQADSIQMVEKTIPELCRVNAEMLEVEIKIRRARKYRSKAEEKDLKEMGEKENNPNVAGLSIEA